jgi:glycosyltransferase involved in cell wall biosynthesis
VKVVHLAPFFQAGYAGGIQRYVAELARAQRAEGIDASVLTLRLHGRGLPDPEGVGDTRADMTGAFGVPVKGRDALFVWQRTAVHPRFISDLRRLDADVVHLHSPTPSIEAALLLGRPRRGRLVVTVHNDLPRTTALQRMLGGVEHRLLDRILGRADAVVAPHEAFARHALFGRAIEDRLHIVPPGVDHQRFRPLSLNREDGAVLFVGHVRPEKGLHVLIEAMARLPHRRLEVLASVSYESAYYEATRALAQSILGDRVAVCLNPSPEDLELAYNRAACVAVPSLGLESWNLVLLEAASTGAACVRSDLPGLAWADFAAVVRVNDAPSLARSIDYAITHREELGRKAEQRAHEYSWQRTCRETLAVYATTGA